MNKTPETDALEYEWSGDPSASGYRETLEELCRKLENERDGWREAAYGLGEALPPSWEELQPPAAQLAKFKEMVGLVNEKYLKKYNL